MPLRRDHPVMRVLGIGMGLGFLALGLFALLGAPRLAAAEGSRALGLGLTFIVVGVVAVVASLTVAEPKRIW